MNLENMTIAGLIRAYGNKSLDSREVREEYLEKTAQLDKRYSLFITRFEKENATGNFIPAAAADNLCLEGERTTCGSRLMAGYVSPFSAVALEKAMGSGFDILGKSNLDEFGLGSTGVSSFKATDSPWRKGYQGGSGAAAAVAAGAVMAAFASDTRGELRQSAACSGVVGIKPTYGRVSRRGLIDHGPSLDQVGVLTRRVEDAAYCLEIISGHDRGDPTTMDEPVNVPSFKGKPKQSPALACPREWSEARGLKGPVKDFFAKTLQTLRAQGIEVRETSLPAMKAASWTAAVIAAVEAFSTLANFDGVRFGARTPGKHLQDMYIQTRGEGLGVKVKEFLTFGALVSSGKYYQDSFLWAQRCRRLIRDSLLALLQETPLMILPTMPMAPPPLTKTGEEVSPPASEYTSLANLAGLPAVSLPAGTHEGLPLGIQLVGRPFGEHHLLEAAALLEEIISFPGLAPDVQEGK